MLPIGQVVEHLSVAEVAQSYDVARVLEIVFLFYITLLFHNAVHIPKILNDYESFINLIQFAFKCTLSF